MGVRFDPWQTGVGTIALGKRADGKYAATVGGVVLSIPRQVGKTFLVGMILIALCLLFPGLTCVWTAHRTRTATKTFQTLKGYTSRKRIKPHMLEPRNVNGEQEVRFRNGSVIMFGAREQGFGRGFDEVDVEVFDEAQILTEKALEDMVPAANQSRHEAGALLFFMGTPPRPTDPGEEFTNRRTKALSGKSANMVYVEFSADVDADPDDRAQWAKANVSFPHRTPVEAMERMREQLTDDDSFRREALGIWDADESSVIPNWSSLLDQHSKIESGHRFALEVGPGRKWSCFAVAGRRADGLFHVEVTGSGEGDAHRLDHRAGTDWIVARGAELSKKWDQPIRIEKGSDAAAFITLLREAGAKVDEVPSGGHAVAAGVLMNACANGGLRHVGQQALASAVKGARLKVSGESEKWARRNSRTDITPLVAVTLALGGVPESEKKFFMY